MADKKTDVPAEKAADTPTELTDAQTEKVAGGRNVQSIYDKPGTKFE